MNSLEKSPSAWHKPGHSRSSSTASSRHTRQNSRDWEVMEDIHNEDSGVRTVRDVAQPGNYEGYLMKKRKWPLNGWHKRYFVLDRGILKYAKSEQDIIKGKIHGSIDVSLAVMSINKKSKRIDLDAGYSLYHMKAKRPEVFYIWVTKLCAHRVFKKNEAVRLHADVLAALSNGNTPLPSMASLAQSNGSVPGRPLHPQYQAHAARIQQGVNSVPPGVDLKVSTWLQQAQDPECCSQELAQCQADLAQLSQLIQKLESLPQSQPIFENNHRTAGSQYNTLEKVRKKSTKILGNSRSLSRVEALNMYPSDRLNASVPSIPDFVRSQAPASLPYPQSTKLQREVCALSYRVHASLKNIFGMLSVERERLQQAWTGPDLHQSTSAQLATLCTTLSELEMQSRLTRVHSLSLSSDSTEESFRTVNQPPPSVAGQRMSVASTPSISESCAEYFDASDVVVDVVVCGSSSENEASDDSCLSDVTTSNSDPEEGHITRNYRASLSGASVVATKFAAKVAGRRTSLPAPCPSNSHVGLWNILYNNIGKDLSRVSMPVVLNEPLCFLQRLCEELEYSELLDTANRTDDPYERMVYVAAFAISAYFFGRHRNRYKPFNPVLGETYECVRDDKGFRYVSEQVSHHPPISACHAESENFTFWQDQRWKNKFWGKSVEVIPVGMVNVTLPRYGDHYEWNKVTTCIHNILSQQRWLEHYGEILIRNTQSNVCTCKITFVKSRYWSPEINEVQGSVLDAAGNVVHRFGGLWHEGIICDTLPTPQCVWKPYPVPADYFQCYGFSQYARELNELTPDLRPLLPPTDTRFRPDQRLLEEGKVDEAEKKKDQVEQVQRDRRKVMEKRGEAHIPRFFRKSVDSSGKEVWISNGTYWKIRQEPGFAHTDNLDLW
ncbi:oxysterol-binding protein-related protein 7 [Lepisosteus oculatus]|uniref:oxysterol-binding protein-related protein 7 n=1 Tax=Lepisosteus oculatus TaxID=7918 RepID=UPI00370FFDFE